MKTGDRLFNGAIVLEVRKHKNEGLVVLAETDDCFVTWRCTNDRDTIWGHYFPKHVDGALRTAVADYLER